MGKFVKVKLGSFHSDTQGKTVPAGLEIQVQTNNSSRPDTWEVARALISLGYCKAQKSSLQYEVIG